MTGYLYQCELALLGLAERSWDDATVEVRMEVLDDIEFLHGSTSDPFELLQSKHRERAGRFSETGKDFWRSVASWIDALTALGCLSAGPMPQLRLITTQVTADGDFLHHLRSGPGRSVDDALDRMYQIARASDPDTTATDRKKFADLTLAQRRRLVAAVEINHAYPVMSDLGSRLARALGIRPGEHADAILHDVKGWWYSMAVELLDRRQARASVTAQELSCRLQEITDRYAGANLPVTESLRRLTSAEIAAHEHDLVVAQMRWVGVSDRGIATHLRDFYFSRAQRSSWLRTFKITEEGLRQYEQRLWDEWDHVFSRHTNAVEDSTPAEQRAAVGRRVLDDTMDRVAGIPARPGSSTEAWIGRGTMHGLADQAHAADEDCIGWHPDFPDLCLKHGSREAGGHG